MTQFSAGSQALGYLYQARYALYLILTKDEDKQGIAIEGLDDIVLDEKGEPQELLQLKHHNINNQANLTNTSPDLWKTLRVWSTYIQEGKIDLSKITLTLVTTSSTSKNSATSLLKTENRNPQQAHAILLNVPQKSQNKDTTMRDCFNSFFSLSNENQIALLNSIYILDQSSNIVDIAFLNET